MALIKIGRFEDIGVTLSPEIKTRAINLGIEKTIPKTLSLDASREIRADIKPVKIETLISEKKWGLYLKRFTLNKNFECFLAPEADNEVFFASFAWDYSGGAPMVYPPKEVEVDAYKFKVKPKETREFIGDGVCLWTPREVAGSLNVAIIVYEHDGDVRHLGETLTRIHDAVGSSSLAQLLTTILNPAAITGTIAGAVLELIATVGGLMAADKNDWVDTLQGSWGTDKEQKPGGQSYSQAPCSIELDFTIT